MIDDMHEVEELMAAMKACLPILVCPSKTLVQRLRQNGIHAKTNQCLEIIDLPGYAGDEGGITCMLKRPDAYVVSLTHLLPLPSHALASAIKAYQKSRMRGIGSGFKQGAAAFQTFPASKH